MGSGFGRGRQMAGSPEFKSAFADMSAANRDAGMGGPDKRGGLFGSGMGGEDFINILTRAAALAQGDYGGAAQIGQLIGKPKRDQQKRQEDFEDWRKQYDYQVENAKPVNNDTVADYEYIRQNLGEEAAKQFLQNKADPPQYRQGPDGQFYRISPTQGAAPQQNFDPAEWEPFDPQAQGGAPATPARTFPAPPPRRRY